MQLYPLVYPKFQKVGKGDALMEYAGPLRVKKIVKDLIELWL